MAYPYLSEEDSLADLDSRITGDDRDVFKNYGHLRIEPAFDNRLFLIYKPTGLTREGRHRDPEILTTIKILRLDLNSRDGATCVIADQSTGAKMDLGYIPRRVFHYDLFMAVPPILRLRWDGRLDNGSVQRSLSYGLLIKTKNRSDFFSAGNTYAETPNRFREMFPTTEFRLQYI